MKYHISPTTGDPKRCLAELRECPVGGANEHYASEAEARDAYEQRQETIPASVKVNQTYTPPKTWQELPENPSRAQLMAASAYAREKNAYVAAGFSHKTNEPVWKLQLDYDGTGHEGHILDRQHHLYATPTGEFVRVEAETSVVAEMDSYWEFDPRLEVEVKVFGTASKVRANKFDSAVDISLWEENQEALRETDRWGGSSPSYNWADAGDTMRAARSLLKTTFKPNDFARAATLATTAKKITQKEHEFSMNSQSRHLRQAAVGRKDFPKNLHEKALNDVSTDVLAKLAQRKDLSSATFKALLTQTGIEHRDQNYVTVGHRAMANPALPATLQKKVASTGVVKDLEALARNTSLKPEARSIMETRLKDLGLRMPWGEPFRP